MVTFRGWYRGAKRCEVEHIDSTSRLMTAAPKDNNGDGSTFSPTDLCTTSLVTCMMTVMGIVADRNGLDLTGSWYSFEKTMSADSPRRIAVIAADFHLPAHLLSDQRQLLEGAALNCPVYHSLHSDIEKKISFSYDVAGV
jgi:putative redox protein